MLVVEAVAAADQAQLVAAAEVLAVVALAVQETVLQTVAEAVVVVTEVHKAGLGQAEQAGLE